MQPAAVLASSELAGQTAWKQEFKRMKRLESVGITWPKVLVLVFFMLFASLLESEHSTLTKLALCNLSVLFAFRIKAGWPIS